MEKKKSKGFGKLVLLHNISASVISGIFLGCIFSAFMKGNNGATMAFCFFFSCLFLGIMIFVAMKEKNDTSKAKEINNNINKKIIRYSLISAIICDLFYGVIMLIVSGLFNCLPILLFSFLILFSSDIFVSYFIRYIILNLNEFNTMEINQEREKGVVKVLKYSLISFIMSMCIIFSFALFAALIDTNLYNFFDAEIIIIIIMVLLITLCINCLIGLIAFLEKEQKSIDKKKVTTKKKVSAKKQTVGEKKKTVNSKK